MAGGRPASGGAARCPRRRDLAEQARPAGSGDWSARSRTTPGACAASMARTSAGQRAVVGGDRHRAGDARRRREARGRAGRQRLRQVHPHVRARRVNAAWSAADLVQLACCASASVPVATAITSSSAAPPWRSGWRLNCQPASARSAALPRGGQPVGGPRRGGQQPQREHRPAGQRERGGEREHRVDGGGERRSTRWTPRSSGAAASPPAPRARRGRGRRPPGWRRRSRPAGRAGPGPRPVRAAAPGRASRRPRSRRRRRRRRARPARCPPRRPAMPPGRRPAARVERAAEQPGEPDARDGAGQRGQRRTAGSPRRRSAW